MRGVHLRGMDLNLLIALDTLLEERSVTRAARRVGLTQPAMSRALGRLRIAFRDELLIRAGRGLTATPRALGLRLPLRRALEQLGAVVAEVPTFDPATARRTFTISTVDYGVAVVLPPLVAHLAVAAPQVDLAVRHQDESVDEDLAAGRIDLVISPRRPSPPGLVWTRLFFDEQVCLVRRGHPAVGRELSLEQFRALGHVFVTPTGQQTGVVDRSLHRRGLTRRVVLRVPTFLAAPLVVARTDLIATVAGRVARTFAGRFPIRAVPPPVELPRLEVCMAWHERMRHEPGHAWLRRTIVGLGL